MQNPFINEDISCVVVLGDVKENWYDPGSMYAATYPMYADQLSVLDVRTYPLHNTIKENNCG
jgi:hypothetical protein